MMMVKILLVNYSFYLADKINTLIKSAGVNVESYWAKLFAKAVAGQDISSFFNFGGSSSSGPVAS